METNYNTTSFNGCKKCPGQFRAKFYVETQIQKFTTFTVEFLIM